MAAGKALPGLSLTRIEQDRAERDLARSDAALARLGNSEDPFASAVWATRMPIVVTNPRLADNPIVFINDAFSNLTGYSREEMLGQNCRLLQGPETDPEKIMRLREAVLAHEPIDIEIKNYRKDGKLFWNRLHVVPLHDGAGRLTYFFASQLDVTIERERLAFLESQNSALFEEMAARERAELSNVEKSRFLAVASHDIRQPLQSLILMQSTLVKTVQGQEAEKLVRRLGQMLDSMSFMLNSLLDLNQIEAGAVRTELADVPVGDILNRMAEGFAFDAQAKGLMLHVVPCGLSVRSDPQLLEQMIRNLVANAIKYTKSGKILLGCRRNGSSLNLEVWDTGIGIHPLETKAIFREYHQLNTASHRSNQGLGLGLAIVQRFGALLNHPVRVDSHLGKGSLFTIELPIVAKAKTILKSPKMMRNDNIVAQADERVIRILLVENDPDTRRNLEILLGDEGYIMILASHGEQAIEMVEHENVRPDLIMTDSRLLHDHNGLTFITRLRKRLAYEIPVIMFTGEVSTKTLIDLKSTNTLNLIKPVKLREMIQAIQRMVTKSHTASIPVPQRQVMQEAKLSGCLIFVVDDNEDVGKDIRTVIEAEGGVVETYGTSEAFLTAYRPGAKTCLLVDAYLPGMSGIDLLRQLRHDGDALPAIVITGNSDIAMAVASIKAGASDFIEKPVGAAELLSNIHHAIDGSRDSGRLAAWRETASMHLDGLSARQHQIMAMVLAGQPSKNIAVDLAISQRTVENHRASIMRKTGARSLPALARLALAANWDGPYGPVVMPALV